MTGQQLKNSILQLAIQGKLVPQNPDDEPASELLKRIREEKEKLVKEKKLKKSALNVTPIREDEKPFELKDGWVWCRLNEISLDSADGPFGSNLKREHYTENREVRIIQLSNIGELGWKDANVRYTTFEHLPNISRSEAFAGDIIIAKMMPAGRAIICPNHESKFVLSSDAVRFDFSNELYKKYLYYAINSSVFKEQVYGQVQGITRVRTSLNKLRTYILPIPPISEQHHIVQKIEELMPLVEEYDKAQKELNTLNANLPKTLKRCILQEAIQGKLGTNNPDDEPASDLLKRIREEKARLIKEKKIKKENPLPEISEDEKPFDIPDNWVWIRGGNAFVSTKNQIPSGEYFNYIDTDAVNNKTHVITPKRMRPQDASSRARRVLDIGDVIYSKVRPYLQNIALIDNEELACCIGSTGFYVMRTLGLLVPRFLLYLTLTPYFTDGINQFMKGEKSPSVNDDDIENFIIPLPPLQEQHRIVQRLNEILPKLKNLE